MRAVISGVLAAGLLVSSSFAATVADKPLPAGKPAGVKEAQAGGAFLWVAGAALVIGGIVLVASNGKNNNPTTSTATTAP